MIVCSYAVWQYREEDVAEDGRRILWKNAGMILGSTLSVLLRVGILFLVRPS